MRSGHRSWKAAKVTRKKPESKQKSPPKEKEGLLPAPGVLLGSDAPAAAEEPGGGARDRGEPPVRGRAGGWTPGKMRRARARRGGFEARRGAGRAGGRRLSVGAGAQPSTRGAQP